MKRSRFRLAVAACLPLAVVAALLSESPASVASSVVAHRPAAPAARQVLSPGPNALADPAAVLGSGYKSSQDRAVTVAGDATGLHVLVADESDGYAWRTAATLSVPGTDTTQWIGQACVTGDGQQAVVVYAPRQITNTPDALGDGALAAVVDLSTGKVTPVGAGVSIAYFDPGCGTGQQAVLTQGGTGAGVTADQAYATHLMTLDTATGKVTSDVRVPGEVTSAVPYGGQTAAVSSAGVVSIGSDGKVSVLAHVPGTAFRLSPDAAGGLGFLVASGKRVQVHRYAAGADQQVESAALGSVGLTQTGGRVFVTGPHAAGLGTMPSGWRALDVPAGSAISSTGALAVTGATTPVGAKGTFPGAAPPDAAQPTRITGQATATGKAATFSVPAAEQQTRTPLPAPLPGFPGAPAASGTAGTAAGTVKTTALTTAVTSGTKPDATVAGTPDVTPPPSSANPATTTYDPDRSCSVPRNDPSIQTYQASAPEIEWAVDEGVQGHLTDTQPANLYGSGLPSYSPQGLFPLPGLTGGGTVPAPVMLGILAQESNEDQASPHAIIGQTGNFNPSYSWYGDGGDYTYVDWAASDCGYGIAQVTSGMCLAGAAGCSDPLPYEDQLAAAVDFQANIAAGLQILEQKYNQVRALNMTTNGGGNPAYVENWWYALWAYNSGLEPNAANGNTTGCSPGPDCTDAPGNGPGGNWGLGWVDNPINPMYPPDRPMFLSSPLGSSYNYNYDEANPQLWSYEEKVIGFAAYGLVSYNYITEAWGQSYATTVYPTYDVEGLPVQVDPSQAEPSFGTFCNSTNNCVSSDTAAPCQLTSGADADHCWWNQPVSWVSCAVFCGTVGPLGATYGSGSADPGDPGVPSGYAPACTSSPLPASAVIVGDTASSIPAPLGCGTSWSNNGGTMTWNFGADVGKNTTTYPSKIDFHQIGGGYSGHYWFTHTVPSDSNDPSSVQPQSSDAELVDTGTWTPPSSVKGWTRIMAAIPDEGAWDPEANYQINVGNGTTEYSVVNQGYQTDTWVDLGTYDLTAGASVSLSNVTYLGLGDDIAWDAMAFVPASGDAVNYVAMGDSYSAGAGNAPYQSNSNSTAMAGVLYQGNNCYRSVSGAYPTMVTLPGQSQPIATQAQTLTGNTEFHFIACNGAKTRDVSESALDDPPTAEDLAGNTDWGPGNDDSGENPQDSQGDLTSQTTLVTISIGGNDARFSDVLRGCLLTTGDCIDSDYYLTRGSNGAVDPQPLVIFEPYVINGLESHLESVYESINAKAPDAKIVVLGYPNLFPASPTSSCQVGPGVAGVGAYMNVGDQIWLNSMGAQLNQTIGFAVTDVKSLGVNIRFVNPTSAFSGHELCSSSPWIYPIGVGLITGLNPGSFHPTVAGQEEFATLINGCLAGTVSC